MAAARTVAATEIVAVDAMQVYRGMDIGTAKPTPAERTAVAHHCLDLVEPTESFSVTDYQRAYDAAIATIHGRPLLVAGTGLYLVAVIDRLEVPGRWPDVRAALEADAADHYARLRQLDPVAASRIEPTNTPTRRAGARGHDRLRTSVQLVRAGVASHPPTDAAHDRAALVPTGAGPTHRGAGALDDRRWPARRGAPARGGRALVADGRARRSATRSCSTNLDVPTATAAIITRTRRSPCAKSGGSVGTHAYAGSTSSTIRSPRRGPPWSRPSAAHECRRTTGADQAPWVRE